MRLIALAAVALLTAAVAGCAVLPESGDLPEGGFELSGRVAVRWRGEAVTGRVDWRHAPRSDEMLITNPLGQGVARISRRSGPGGQTASLETADGKRHEAADSEELTARILGWRLPLEGLPHWVRGQPLPERPSSIQHDEQGRVAAIEQDGWRIQCADHEDDGRPRRFVLSREGLDIRLFVDRWTESVPEPRPGVQ